MLLVMKYLDKQLKTSVGGGAGVVPPDFQVPRDILKAVVQVPMLILLHMDVMTEQRWVEMIDKLAIYELLSKVIGWCDTAITLIFVVRQTLREDFQL